MPCIGWYSKAGNAQCRAKQLLKTRLNIQLLKSQLDRRLCAKAAKAKWRLGRRKKSSLEIRDFEMHLYLLFGVFLFPHELQLIWRHHVDNVGNFSLRGPSTDWQRPSSVYAKLTARTNDWTLSWKQLFIIPQLESLQFIRQNVSRYIQIIKAHDS